MDESGNKRCPVCREVKPLTEFGADRSRKDGRYPCCRVCSRKRVRRDREQNPDKLRSQWRQYHARLSDAVFSHYGRVCACPGCGADENLTIDHVHGDGKEHRAELFGWDTACTPMYRWLIKNNFPDGFQTLCASCNSSKGRGAACHLDHSAVKVS